MLGKGAPVLMHGVCLDYVTELKPQAGKPSVRMKGLFCRLNDSEEVKFVIQETVSFLSSCTAVSENPARCSRFISIITGYNEVLV